MVSILVMMGYLINIIVVLCFSVDRPTVLDLGKFENFLLCREHMACCNGAVE